MTSLLACCALAATTSASALEAPAAAPAPRPADIDAPPRADPSPEAVAVAPAAAGAGPRAKFRALLQKEAAKTGLPVDVADAVVAIESGYDPSVVGSVGEIGLMQVRPQTAAMLGFRGDDAELARPEVNIRYGVAYLAQAWRLAGGDLCRSLMKYRAGHGEEQMTPLSVEYCRRARAHLASAGSAPAMLSGPLPAPSEAAPARLRIARPGPRRGTEAASRLFWAAQEARVAALTRKLHAKWRRMASR